MQYYRPMRVEDRHCFEKTKGGSACTVPEQEQGKEIQSIPLQTFFSAKVCLLSVSNYIFLTFHVFLPYDVLCLTYLL